MITIKRAGQPLDLGNLQLTFRLRSPLWNDVPSHTFSFDIDNNDNNRLILGLLHRPTNTQATGQTCAVECDVHGWKLGATLKVQSATEKVLRCFLAIDNGQLNMDWGDEYLDQMPFPTIWRTGGVTQVMYYNIDKSSDEVACQFPPTRIPEYFGSEASDDALYYTGWINSFDPEIGLYDYPSVNGTTGKSIVPTVSVPMFYLRWVLQQTMMLKGINLNISTLKESELINLLIFNNYCAEIKRRRFYFRASKDSNQTIYQTGGALCTFNDTYNSPNIVEENCFDSWNYTIKEWGIHTFYVYLNVLAKDGQFAEAIIDGRTYDLKVGDNIITVERYYTYSDVNKTVSVWIKCYNQTGSPPVITYKWINIGANSYFTGRNTSLSTLPKLYTDVAITPANHMPKVKIKELFAWLKDGFACQHIYNAAARELRFVFLRDVITSPAKHDLGDLDSETEYSPEEIAAITFAFDISSDDAPLMGELTGFNFLGEFNSFAQLPLPEIGNQIAYVPTSGKYYVYTWNDTSSRYEWQTIADYMIDATNAAAQMEVKPAWHPPAHFFEGDIFGHTPHVGCKGSSPYFKVGVNKPPLLLMFYHGMQRSVHDALDPWYFPLASGLMHDTFGLQIGTLEMRWDGDNGLRETYWRAVEEFYAQRWGLEARRQIDAAFLKQLAWDEGYLHKGREYLLDTVEFTVTQLGFTTAKITAWRKG